MFEASHIITIFSAILLVAAGVAWVKLLSGPLVQRIDGLTRWNPAQAELASQLLICATGLSAAAAILAITGWMFA